MLLILRKGGGALVAQVLFRPCRGEGSNGKRWKGGASAMAEPLERCQARKRSRLIMEYHIIKLAIGLKRKLGQAKPGDDLLIGPKKHAKISKGGSRE